MPVNDPLPSGVKWKVVIVVILGVSPWLIALAIVVAQGIPIWPAVLLVLACYVFQMLASVLYLRLKKRR